MVFIQNNDSLIVIIFLYTIMLIFYYLWSDSIRHCRQHNNRGHCEARLRGWIGIERLPIGFWYCQPVAIFGIFWISSWIFQLRSFNRVWKFYSNQLLRWFHKYKIFRQFQWFFELYKRWNIWKIWFGDKSDQSTKAM